MILNMVEVCTWAEYSWGLYTGRIWLRSVHWQSCLIFSDKSIACLACLDCLYKFFCSLLFVCFTVQYCGTLNSSKSSSRDELCLNTINLFNCSTLHKSAYRIPYCFAIRESTRDHYSLLQEIGKSCTGDFEILQVQELHRRLPDPSSAGVAHETSSSFKCRNCTGRLPDPSSAGVAQELQNKPSIVDVPSCSLLKYTRIYIAVTRKNRLDGF